MARKRGTNSSSCSCWAHACQLGPNTVLCVWALRFFCACSYLQSLVLLLLVLEVISRDLSPKYTISLFQVQVQQTDRRGKVKCYPSSCKGGWISHAYFRENGFFLYGHYEGYQDYPGRGNQILMELQINSG